MPNRPTTSSTIREKSSRADRPTRLRFSKLSHGGGGPVCLMECACSALGMREDCFDSGSGGRPEDLVGRVAGYRQSHRNTFAGGDCGRESLGLAGCAEDQFDCVEDGVVEVGVIALLEVVELGVCDL